MKNSFRDDNGQVLVLTALSMAALLGFMALAIDVGMLFRAKRNLQMAADAAATSAALDYFYNRGSNTAVSAAQTVGTRSANDNGISTSNGATISIKSGGSGTFATPWHDSTGYFEATLTQPSPLAFMALFGYNSVPVVARAVAGTPGGSNENCITVLGTTGTLGAGASGGDSTVWLQGSFQVNGPKCGMQIDGTGSDTLHYNGSGGSTSLAYIGVVGGAGGNVGSYSPAPVTSVAAVSDPLSADSFPTPTSCITPPGGAITGTIGTSGGTVCYQGNVTVTNAVLSGTVIFNGGNVTWGGNVSSGTGGTTIDIVTGGMQENSGTVFNLTAQTTGTMPNVVLAAPTTNTSVFEIQFGNCSGTFNGIVYLPAATMYFQDSGGDHSGGLTFNIDLVVGQLDDKTATLNINGFTAPGGSPDPLALVTLVE